MIVRAAERAAEENANMRGGDGTVVRHVCALPRMPENAKLFQEIVLNPGCSIGLHSHSGEYEIFYFMTGEITLHDNGEEKLMHPGDFSICYDGETHGIANYTQEPASVFAAIIKTK